jgi:hypothetical protein
VALAAAFTEEGPVTLSENELVTVIAATPLLEGSATLTAVTETLGGAVKNCGAVYVPVGSIVPHADPAHSTPATIQMTARSGSPAEFTVAAKGRAAPSSTGIACGETETDMSLVIVIVAVALFVASATLAACTVTVVLAGKSPGDVYNPFELIVPTVMLPPGIPFTLQVTAVFVVFPTVATNVCGAPSSTEAAAGVTFTVTVGGGGCVGAEPTTPPQPRKDATRSSAGRRQNNGIVKRRRPPCAVPLSIATPIARAVPERSRQSMGRRKVGVFQFFGLGMTIKSLCVSGLLDICLRGNTRSVRPNRTQVSPYCNKFSSESGRSVWGTVSYWGGSRCPGSTAKIPEAHIYS